MRASDLDAPGEGALPPDVLEGFRELIEARAGVVVGQEKRASLVEAVQAALEVEPGATASELLARCRAEEGPGSPFEVVLAPLLVGETHFFRNRPQFEVLAEVVLPELLERASARRELTAWSAGCSTGEEPYSLAITLHETMERLGHAPDSWRLRVIGTDVSARALELARSAEYGRYSFRGVSDEERTRWFDQIDSKWRVREPARSLVEFAPLNLVSDRFPDPDTPFHDVDLIVCRNVTIYFSEETTRDLADRFHETLVEGGYLLVGHAEHSLTTYRRFETRALPHVILYQKGGDRAPGMSLRPEWSAPAAARTVSPAASRPPRRLRSLATVDVPATLDEALPGRTPHVRSAREALAAGDWNRAVAELVEVVEEDPDHEEACLILGRLAADRGHVTEAEIWIRRAIDIRPLDARAHFLLALLLRERGADEGVVAALDRALYLEPDLVVAHYLRARVLRERGRDDAARRSLRAALRALEALDDAAEVPLADGLTAQQLRAALGASGS